MYVHMHRLQYRVMCLSLNSTSLIISPQSLHVLTQVGPVLLQVDGETIIELRSFLLQQSRGNILQDEILIHILR